MFSLTSIVERNKGISWRIIEDRAVLVDESDNRVLQMDEVGTEIWKCIEDRIKIEDIVRHICQIFEVDEERATKDTIEFLKQLMQREFIKVVQ